MAGGFAADVVTVCAHVLEHIAVANRRSHQFEAKFTEVPFKTKVGHHRGDDARALKSAILFPTLRYYGQQLVTVHDVSALIHDDDAVSVAIEGDSDIRAHFAHLA